MALSPKIKLTISNNGDFVNVYEKTGPFVTGVYNEGWGQLNINTNEIFSAKVDVYRNDDEAIPTNLVESITLKDTTSSPQVDVYTNVAGSPFPAEFTAIVNRPWNNGEGVFKLIYTIVSNPATGSQTIVGNTSYVLFIPSLCNCLNEAILKLIGNCDKDYVEKMQSMVNEIELYKYSIESAFSCGKFDQVNKLLADASTLCQVVGNDCGCGC